MNKLDLVQRLIQVEHVKIQSTKSFAEVKATLEGSVPRLDAGVLAQLQQGESERARSELVRLPALSIFSKRDHGHSFRSLASCERRCSMKIGNPLTATQVTQHQLPAALYAPLRVLLYEDEAGRAVFEYDRPASLFGQFGDERVTAVARELDAKLESALIRAAS